MMFCKQKLQKMILNTQRLNLRNNHSFLLLLVLLAVSDRRHDKQSNIKRNQKSEGVGVCAFWMKRETGNFEVYRTIIISSNHHHNFETTTTLQNTSSASEVVNLIQQQTLFTFPLLD
jgi:hypothetical protein